MERRRSVIAAQHAMAIVIRRGRVAGGAVAVAGSVAVAIAVIAVMPAMITRIGGVAVDRGAFALSIGRIGCEVAGTAVGRALVGVVVRMHRAAVRLILVHLIGQPLIGAAAAGAA